MSAAKIFQEEKIFKESAQFFSFQPPISMFLPKKQLKKAGWLFPVFSMFLARSFERKTQKT